MTRRIFRSLSSSRAFSSLVPLIPPMVVVFLLALGVALLIRTSSVVQMILLGFLPLVLLLLTLSLGSPLQ
jgi:hypothetical protein